MDSLKSDNPPICSICIANLLSTESRIAALKCGHTFHHWCIDAWLDTKESCPICSRHVYENDLRDLYFSSAYEQADYWEKRMQQIQNDFKFQLDCQTMQMRTLIDANDEQFLMSIIDELEKQKNQQIKRQEAIINYISDEAALALIERICLLYIVSILIWPHSVIVLTGIILFAWFIVYKTMVSLQNQLDVMNLKIAQLKEYN